MSASSFPRPEHIALLREKIQERIRRRSPPVEVTDRGLNHLTCQYKFGFRRLPQEEWTELAIHFQFADRLQASASDLELNRLIDAFLNQHFG